MIKVLIAEDERVMRFMITDFLESFGYQVIQSDNGIDAYVLWKKEKPDILVTDINMPKMNGIDLLKKIKEKEPNFPVVLITGVTMEKVKCIVNENNADGFLTKPFKMKELINLLQKLTHS